MSECTSCGAHVSPDEHFCGNCGAQITPRSVEMQTVSATPGDEEDLLPRGGREWATTLEPNDETPIIPEDSIHETASSDGAAVAEAREPSGSLETTYVDPDSVESTAPISSASFGGSYTDSVEAPGTSTPEKATTGRKNRTPIFPYTPTRSATGPRRFAARS